MRGKERRKKGGAFERFLIARFAKNEEKINKPPRKPQSYVFFFRFFFKDFCAEGGVGVISLLFGESLTNIAFFSCSGVEEILELLVW